MGELDFSKYVIIIIMAMLICPASYETFPYALLHLFFMAVLSKKVGQALLSPLFLRGKSSRDILQSNCFI
jgi:general stress protein CsbA